MASRLKDIKENSASIEDLAYWINERHSIFVNRFGKKLPKPWTDDPIFQQYKFTNVFRQLDKGTLVLQDMLELRQSDDPALIFFNIVWYRLFNWHEHGKELGFIEDFKLLDLYIKGRFRTHKKIFTGAHMTTGVAYEDKHISYLRACKMAWDRRHEFIALLEFDSQDHLQDMFEKLLDLYMVGRFVAYELVCDLRFTKLLDTATDKLTWANMGPGAQRGLRRLGFPHKNQQQGLMSMRILYEKLPLYLDHHIMKHLMNIGDPPFELREVEHSLCEFDKYQRVKLGEGRPRSKYNGMSTKTDYSKSVDPSLLDA